VTFTPRASTHIDASIVGVALEIEGLFRVCGSRDQVMTLRKHFEKGKQVSLSEYHPHVVAETLKGYLRGLRANHEPLCTYELYAAFMEAVGMQ
jgi:hypothetical protein